MFTEWLLNGLQAVLLYAVPHVYMYVLSTQYRSYRKVLYNERRPPNNTINALLWLCHDDKHTHTHTHT